MRLRLIHLAVLMVAGLLFGSACAHRPAPLPFSAAVDGGREGASFEVTYSEADFEILREVGDALRHAVSVVKTWGSFTETVTVRIYPTHRDLELAVNRPNYPWLRAWARYQNIYLQSPRTWGGRSFRSRLRELLAHELTHVLMYQRSASEGSWRYKGIPAWFREGMASVTARQGYRRLSPEDIARRLEKRPDVDPFGTDARLYQEEPDLVYSAAHHLFDHLVGERGPEGIRALMDRMKQGKRFSRAFAELVGQTPEAYASEWLSAVVNTDEQAVVTREGS